MELEQYIILVILVFVRITSFFSVLSFFRGNSIPLMAKSTLSISMSLLIASKMEVMDVTSLWELSGFIVIEIMIGVILALVIEMVISVILIAGSLLDMDIGLSNPFNDGISGAQATVLSKIFYYVFLIIFIISGSFEKVLYTLSKTFSLNIKKDFLMNPKNIDFFIDLFQFMFFGALQIAIPFMMSTFLVYIALLLMSKVVDKINILMNVFGIKIFVGITLVVIMIPSLIIVFQQLDEQLLEKLLETINVSFER